MLLVAPIFYLVTFGTGVLLARYEGATWRETVAFATLNCAIFGTALLLVYLILTRGDV